MKEEEKYEKIQRQNVEWRSFEAKFGMLFPASLYCFI